MKEETSYAKQLFMFGEGNTRPIKNVRELSAASGAPLETLRPWLPKWRKECVELAKVTNNPPLEIVLSEEIVNQHRSEVIFLGNQVKKLRTQLKELDPDSSTYHVVLGSYQSALTKWEKSSGITAHFTVAEVAMKERARTQEKMRAEILPSQPKAARVVDKARFDYDA